MHESNAHGAFACSTAWRCRFLTPRRSRTCAPDSLLDCAQVEGAKEEGIVYLECLKNLNGRLHFTFVGVDVCDIAETRLIVHGSDERMTEKADHLQKLIDFKKDNSPPKE